MAKTAKPTTASPSANTTLDRAAVALSAVCLIHCLMVPFALVLGGLFGNWLADTETAVHWVLLALAAPISLIALTRGPRGNLYLGAAGLTLMLVGVAHWIGASYEVALTVIGVVLVITAHIRNLMHRHSHA